MCLICSIVLLIAVLPLISEVHCARKKPSIAYPADECSLCHTDHFLTRQSDELEDPVLSQYYKSPQPEQLLRPYPHHLKTEYMSSTIPSWYLFSQHQSPQPAHSSIPST